MRAADEHDEQRHADRQPQAAQNAREQLPRRRLPALRPPMQDDGKRDAHDQRRRHHPEARKQLRLRHVEAAIAEKERVEHRHALPHLRQQRQEPEVPEDDLRQQRDVPDRVDIDRRQRRHQPVPRQPRDADHEAEDRGDDDAHRRHDQRVDDADHHRGRRVRPAIVYGMRAMPMLEACLVRQSRSPTRFALGKIDGRVVDEKPADAGEDDDRQHLMAMPRTYSFRHNDPVAAPRCSVITAMAPDPSCGDRAEMHRARPFCLQNRTRPTSLSYSFLAQRIGGAYCSPPLLQSSLRPRASPSGVFWPTLRSKLSP